LSRSTTVSAGSLAARRSAGIHQLRRVAATRADMCQGAVEATEAILMRWVTLPLEPAHSWARAKEARTVIHSARSKRNRPGRPVLPEVALTR
jgi:hypothetical protein